MAQYIDKAALVAKIENRIKELQNLHKENEEKLDSIQKTAILLCIDECKVILSILNTLEVKEVDENNEIIDKLKDIINFHKEKVFKGQWYKWMPEKVSYHNGIISGIKQCLSIIRNR